MSGPLTGVRVIELAAIGPAPFAGMVLADLGAEVIRVDRPGGSGLGADLLARGKRSVVVDAKKVDGVGVIRRLIDSADIVLEGFRPGVLERLGLAPSLLRETNPLLVVGRMTGWGQSSPMRDQVGHDINYISLAGALGAVGNVGEGPAIPLNLVGDFGGGGMLLAVGVLSAYIEAQRNGCGQDVDAAMVDGAMLLSTMIFSMAQTGSWGKERGTNLLDGGAPFYTTYRCADGGYVAVGALEPAFFQDLVKLCDLGETIDCAAQYDRDTWPAMRAAFALAIGGRSRGEWEDLAKDRDACMTPVLGFDELTQHPVHLACHSFVKVGEEVQPGPAPRFSGHERVHSINPVVLAGADILGEVGYSSEEIEALVASGIVAPG
ncbi:MAG: CaiB/BaiF CoA transferase family protein [Ferrimicrobium sp.]